MKNKDLAVVHGVFFGAGEHGYWTVYLNMIGVNGGWIRKFGNLSLDKKLAEDFCKDLLELFEVSDIKDLVGKQCDVTLSDTIWGTFIDGLQNDKGAFTITDWRKKHLLG